MTHQYCVPWKLPSPIYSADEQETCNISLWYEALPETDRSLCRKRVEELCTHANNWKTESVLREVLKTSALKGDCGVFLSDAPGVALGVMTNECRLRSWVATSQRGDPMFHKEWRTHECGEILNLSESNLVNDALANHPRIVKTSNLIVSHVVDLNSHDVRLQYTNLRSILQTVSELNANHLMLRFPAITCWVHLQILHDLCVLFEHVYVMRPNACHAKEIYVTASNRTGSKWNVTLLMTKTWMNATRRILDQLEEARIQHCSHHQLAKKSKFPQ